MLSDDNDVETFSSSESIVDFDEVSSNVMGIDNYQELYSDDVLAALKQLKPQYRSALCINRQDINSKKLPKSNIGMVP